MNSTVETSATDRIEREIMLHATPARVWRALSNPEEFGAWFGVNLKGVRFETGKPAAGNFTIEGYEHMLWDVMIVAMDVERRFAFTWHPHAVEAGVDYSGEASTLVEFTLQAKDGGTLLKVVESGFDKLPPARHLLAFKMNGEGWTEQMTNIQKHVATS